jgi:hypothetical protein
MGEGKQKTYVVTLIYPSPLIGTERHEVEAGSVELALAKAKRLTKVRGCSGTVRIAPALTTYKQDFLDSERARLLDRAPA